MWVNLTGLLAEAIVIMGGIILFSSKKHLVPNYGLARIYGVSFVVSYILSIYLFAVVFSGWHLSLFFISAQAVLIFVLLVTPSRLFSVVAKNQEHLIAQELVRAEQISLIEQGLLADVKDLGAWIERREKEITGVLKSHSSHSIPKIRPDRHDVLREIRHGFITAIVIAFASVFYS